MIARTLKSLGDEKQVCAVLPVVAVGFFPGGGGKIVRQASSMRASVCNTHPAAWTSRSRKPW